jgi:acyl dehydratase
MLGLVGMYFADKGLNAGLEFTFRFQAPVRANEKILLGWRVSEITRKESLRANVIRLQGEAARHDGSIAILASGAVALFDKS